MSNNNKTPAIRFKGFTDTWEQRELGEIATEIIAGSDVDKSLLCEEGNCPVIANALTNDGIIGYYKNEYRVKAPAVTVTGRGDVGHAKARNDDFTPVVRLLSIKSEHDIYFLENAINAIKIVVESTGVPQLTVPQLSKNVIFYPNSAEEEMKIGTYFRNLDSLITLHQRKCDKLIQFKAAMLQKMFPQNGADKPEIRFKGFTDAWEQRELGEVASNFEYGLNASAKEFDGKNKYIRITDIDDESRMFLSDDITSPDTDLTLADKFKLEAGDILFARTGASVGKTYLYREKDGLVYYAGFLIRAKINSENDAEFVFQNTLTDSYNSFIRITSQRSGQPGVNAQEYQGYNFYVPNLEEQKAIGNYFRSLDNLITLHQRKCDKYKSIKAELIRKLFP